MQFDGIRGIRHFSLRMRMLCCVRSVRRTPFVNIAAPLR
jgi:hypothetical protein